MIHGSSRRIMAASLVAVSTLAACSDNTAPKVDGVSVVGNRAKVTGMPNLRSNAIQYRAQTTPYRSNRSGAATLTTRALIGKDGVTQLTVTTGSLDAPSAPGNISKLQVKLFSAGNNPMVTQNLNGLTGPVQTLSFSGLTPQSNIQVQGNVRDIDPKRTDVVTVTEIVNRRPDIAVQSINAPDKVKPNTEVLITAGVAELNGDVGATTNCVLYVNGAEAKRINGMWVADGDAVTCAFRTTLGAPGTYALSVKAENVSPADWDLANNSASRNIEVVTSDVELHGWAYAQEWDYEYRDNYTQNAGYVSGSLDYQYRTVRDYSNVQKSQYSYMSGYVGSVQFPLASASFTVTSDGATLGSVSGSSWTGYCNYTSSNNGYDYIYVCRDNWYQAGHQAGVAVYYDYYFQESWQNGYYYTNGWNNSSNSFWGSFVAPFGSDATMKLVFEDAAGTKYTANASVLLTENYNYLYGPYSGCSNYNDGWWQSNSCSYSFQRQTGRDGGVSF